MEEARIDIGYVAALARLEISEEQLPKLQKDLDNIVGYIASLSELDLTGVEPTAHAAALTNVWREDEAKPSYDRDRMLANAPALIDGDLIRVPQVLPGEGSN
ncbi:Asp-tRNA(Asn)/Glu-tRNA(Gln) amidotransferase subunit GatC [uncultured Victivallis sp.]|uniref:Asp-tRNA(Asn)/Glu-tRNA(Gln) amidotransferase subunit GatC n=1 Tax=uncultured Victivallis sp. TaxID=354118 RepID=UPI0025FBB5B2|nr:Asp-tRNA(Asn)/Glu-tRNA(Gln) amidotransferase subunit GatC [uncultured Victivallis sp.]